MNWSLKMVLWLRPLTGLPRRKLHMLEFQLWELMLLRGLRVCAPGHAILCLQLRPLLFFEVLDSCEEAGANFGAVEGVEVFDVPGDVFG
jgi:hypothetical protein